MNKKRRRRTLLWVILLVPVLLIAAAAALVYAPFVQRWAVDRVIRSLEASTGWEVSVGKARVAFPLRVQIEQLLATEAQDTVLRIDRLQTSVPIMPLFNNRIEVPRLDVSQMQVDLPLDSLDRSRIAARVAELQSGFVQIDLRSMDIDVAALALRGGYFAYTQTDTTESSEPGPDMSISVHRIDLDDFASYIHMYPSGVHTDAHIVRGGVDKGLVRLPDFALSLEHVELQLSEASYATDTATVSAPWVDYAHMQYYDGGINLDDLYVDSTGHVAMDINRLSVRERSGATIRSLEGKFDLQDEVITVRNFDLKTPESDLRGDVVLPLKSLSGDARAEGAVRVRGTLSAQDLFYYTRISPDSLLYPRPVPPGLKEMPMEADLDLSGSLNLLEIKRLYLSVPDLFLINVRGEAAGLSDDARRSGQLQGEVRTGRAAAGLLPLLGGAGDRRLSLPSFTRMEFSAELRDNLLRAKAALKTPRGGVTLSGHYGLKRQDYRLHAGVSGLNLMQFLPQDSVGEISATVNASGRGIDLLSPQASAQVALAVNTIQYKGKAIDSLQLHGTLRNGLVDATLRSGHRSADFVAETHGELSSGAFAGQIDLSVACLDLYALGLADTTWSLSGQLQAELYSDFDQRHKADGVLRRLLLQTGSDTIRTDSVGLLALSDDSQVLLQVQADRLSARIESPDGLSALLQHIDGVADWAGNYDLNNPRVTAYSDLIETLPNARISIEAEHPNLLSRFWADRKISCDELSAHLTVYNQEGINGTVRLSQLEYDSIQCEQATLYLKTLYPSQPIIFDRLSQVARQLPATEMRPLLLSDLNNQFDAQHLTQGYIHPLLQLELSLSAERTPRTPPFQIAAVAQTDLLSASLDFDWIQDHQIYYSLGAKGYYNQSGFGLSIDDKPIYVAGEPLVANEDNALFYFRKDTQLYANLELSGSKGTKITIRSDQEEEAGAQSLLFNVQRFELSDLSRVLNLPDMTGRTFMDVRIEREGRQYRATGDLSVNDMTYQGGDLGNVSAAFFYEPRDNASHYVTAQISSNGDLALMADGVYHSRDRINPLDMEATFNAFPLALANPFVGTDLFALRGALDGTLQVSGTPQSIMLDGAPHISGGAVDLSLTGNTYLLSEKPIEIKKSRLSFDKYNITLQGKPTPLCIDGWLSLFGADALETNLHIYADHAHLLDSKVKYRQALYGRAVLSADLRVRDKLTAPTVRGTMTLHGGTNATYVLSQAPIQAKNNMEGVVEFAARTDSMAVEREDIAPSRSLGRMNLAVSVTIEPAVQIGVDLSSRGEDYVRIIGGGELHFKYPPLGTMSLVGRYDFSGGEVQYQFPVVGRRHFDINDDSYVTWSGDIAEPFLHFTASQRLRADVTEGGETRKVDFDVSIKANEKIKDLALAFDLSAPEDLSVQTKISSMSDEERAKQAVALLLSGTFLAGDMGQISMEQVLSSVAMNELNSLTGRLLQGTDLSLGMELGAFDKAVPTRTNYTYSFSKRFLNDRIRFVIGGRVASGNLPTNYEQTFIDNVTFEYRLDEAGRQYVTLFHRRNNDNILEGVVNETGAGYLVKVRAQRFKDFFDLRNYAWWQRKQAGRDSLPAPYSPPAAPPDPEAVLSEPARISLPADTLPHEASGD